MKKLILSVFVISALCATAFFAEAGYDNSNSKSRRQKLKDEKAKCEAMADNTQKEECLKVLEEKEAKKKAESKE